MDLRIDPTRSASSLVPENVDAADNAEGICYCSMSNVPMEMGSALQVPFVKKFAGSRRSAEIRNYLFSCLVLELRVVCAGSKREKVGMRSSSPWNP